MRRSKLIYRGVAGVALLLVCVGAAAQKVNTTVDKGYDFKAAQRYAWGKNHIITRQGKENDALINKKIVEEVNKTLASKGYVEDEKNPDFILSYDAGSSDLSVKMEGEYSDTKNASTASAPAVYDIPQNVWYSVDGVVTFHALDAKSNKAIWTAQATKKFRDPNKGMREMPRQVQEIVAKSFQKFPARGK